MASSVAACVVQQMLDPAHGERCQFPDDNTRGSFVALSTQDILLDSPTTGQFSVVVNAVRASGITVKDQLGATTSYDLAAVAGGVESYRVLGIRVDITSKATSAQKPGVLEWWCGGGLAPLALLTHNVLRDAVHGLPSVDVQSNPSIGWRPSGVKSFGYLGINATNGGATVDDCGGLVTEVKPGIFMQFRNAEPSVVGLVGLHISVVWECIPEQDATGALLPRQPSLSNRIALDAALNAVNQLKFDFAHKRASDIRAYAVRVRSVLQDPFVFSSVLRGGTPLASIGC